MFLNRQQVMILYGIMMREPDRKIVYLSECDPNNVQLYEALPVESATYGDDISELEFLKFFPMCYNEKENGV